MTAAATSYGAVVIVSFGGPEGPDDVLPFLENVTRGRDIPRDRLEQVAERYFAHGGISPLNESNRALRHQVAAELARSGPPLPVYWGNRNWHPYLSDTVRQMQDDGVTRALAFVTSAYASYSSCRQYQNDLAAARGAVSGDAPELHRIRHYFDHPGFIGPFVRSTMQALEGTGLDMSADTHLVFTGHSIPGSMASMSGPTGGLYATQLSAAARLVADEVARHTSVDRSWSIAYQSRSGPPTVRWLEPDVNDHLRDLREHGTQAVVLVPIGFTADHMEVVHDLDTDAAATAAGLGMSYARAATPGTAAEFVAMVAELVRERTDPSAPRRSLSPLGPAHDVCPLTCCPSLRPAAPAG